MPRSCPTQIRYGPGTINPAPNGRFDCFLWIDGKRYRSRQPNLAMARAWVDMVVQAQRHNIRPLTNIQIADAQQAVERLPPGMTLTEAARAAELAHKGAKRTDITLHDALERFRSEKEISVAAITMQSYAGMVERLEKIVGDVFVHSIARNHIEMMLNGVSPVTRNTKLRTLSVFFNWCRDAGLIDEPPTARIARAKEFDPPKAVFTVEEAKNLMREAEREAPDLIPYLAIGLFAGIRPAELARLVPSKIKQEYIVLDGSVTKTSDARTVHIRPNLRAWLDKYLPAVKHHPLAQITTIIPSELPRRQLYGRTAALSRTIGMEWPKDGMRHSFATYAYELTKDAALVASEMGHRGTDIFFRHYRALAVPGDGKKYFAIRPLK